MLIEKLRVFLKRLDLNENQQQSKSKQVKNIPERMLGTYLPPAHIGESRMLLNRFDVLVSAVGANSRDLRAMQMRRAVA